MEGKVEVMGKRPGDGVERVGRGTVGMEWKRGMGSGLIVMVVMGDDGSNREASW